jgi:SAM-dependent methyltransferase
VQPGDRVLDVATGTGAVLLAALERCGTRGHVIGIDVTEAMLRRAASELEHRSVRNADVRLMDAQQLLFADESFDIVLCSFAFLSFANKARALAEFRRVLKPGGCLGILDSFGWFFEHDSRWAWLADLLRSADALHDAAPRPREGRRRLDEAIRRAGFITVEMSEDSFELRFRDEEEFWLWAWSHGSRKLFEAIPPTKLNEFKSTLFQGLARCREDDQLIHGKLQALITRARRASTPPSEGSFPSTAPAAETGV